MPDPGVRKDPLPAFCFWVRFTSLKTTVETYFKSVSGLRSETEVIPVRAGGANDTTFNLVGATKWSPLVLKQGFTSSAELLAWREAWVEGKPAQGSSGMIRTDGSIILLNTALQPAAQWNFVRAWPSKWELSELDASKSELAIETLELVHEGLKSVPVSAAK